MFAHDLDEKNGQLCAEFSNRTPYRAHYDRAQKKAVIASYSCT